MVTFLSCTQWSTVARQLGSATQTGDIIVGLMCSTRRKRKRSQHRSFPLFFSFFFFLMRRQWWIICGSQQIGVSLAQSGKEKMSATHPTPPPSLHLLPPFKSTMNSVLWFPRFSYRERENESHAHLFSPSKIGVKEFPHLHGGQFLSYTYYAIVKYRTADWSSSPSTLLTPGGVNIIRSLMRRRRRKKKNKKKIQINRPSWTKFLLNF